MLASVFKFMAELLGFASKRQDLNNSAAMQAAAKKKAEQEALDARTKNVSEKNTEATRHDLSDN